MSCISASSSGLFEDAQRRRAEECTPPIIRREYHWSFHHHTKKRRPGLLSRFSSKIGFRKDIRIIISRGKVVVDVNQRRRRVSCPFSPLRNPKQFRRTFPLGKNRLTKVHRALTRCSLYRPTTKKYYVRRGSVHRWLQVVRAAHHRPSIRPVFQRHHRIERKWEIEHFGFHLLRARHHESLAGTTKTLVLPSFTKSSPLCCCCCSL